MSVEKYTSLITSEHNKKPNFMAVVEINTKFYAHVQDILNGFINDFDIDSAIGAQLDIIGQWVGVSRFISTPLTGIYFEWDSSDLVGWDSGIWKSDFDPSTGILVLPDEFYRTLIKAKIAANSWDGTIEGAYLIWEDIFANNVIVIQDNQDMTMMVAITGEKLDAVTQALLTGGYIALKPEGVRISYFVVPINDGPVFAWDTPESESLAGWDLGSWSDLLLST